MTKSLSTIVLLLAATLGAPQVHAAPIEDPALKKANDFVLKLADENEKNRLDAYRSLLDLGLKARAALATGATSKNASVVQLCRQLQVEMVKKNLDKLTESILPENAPLPSDLPGSAEWAKKIGTDWPSRKLYAEMLKAHSTILIEYQLAPNRANELYLQFLNEYKNNPPLPGVNVVKTKVISAQGDLAAYFFLGSLGDKRMTSPATASAHTLFLNNPILQEALEKSKPGDMWRKLMAAWVEKETYNTAVNRLINLAVLNKITEVVQPLLNNLADKTIPTTTRANSMLRLVELIGKDQLHLITPLLKDESQVSTNTINKVTYTVQMRDVALAAHWLALGESLADHGFKRPMPKGLKIVSFSYCGFPTNEDREKALKEWADYAEKNLKPKEKTK